MHAWAAVDEALARLAAAAWNVQTPQDQARLYELREEAFAARDRAMRWRPPANEPARSRRELDERLWQNKLNRKRRQRLSRYHQALAGHLPTRSPAVDELEQAGRARALRRGHACTTARPPSIDAPTWEDLLPGWRAKSARLARAAQPDNQNPPQGSDGWGGWNTGLQMFGVNGVHTCLNDPVWRVDDQGIFKDFTALGAGVLRQPQLDLVLSEFATGGADVDGDGDVGLCAWENLHAAVQSRKTQLKRELEQIAAAGQAVVLTLVSHGGGGSHSGTSADGSVNNAIEVSWEGHLGASIGSVMFKGGSIDDEGILDLRDEYQRLYLATYVTEVCRLLQEIEAESFSSVGLDAVVAGLQIFNEIDVCNIMVHKTATGGFVLDDLAVARTTLWWAEVLWELASAVRAVFPTGIDIILPGLSSADVDDDAVATSQIDYVNTWRWKYAFFQSLTATYSRLLDGHGAADKETYGRGVDHHFYHRLPRTTTGAKPQKGPLHIARLRWQMTQLRSSLTAAGLPWENLTVFESGVSGVELAGDTTEYLPTGVLGHDRWQAWEVWRRVVGAMAASAQVAGWHSWRSLPGREDWYGLGLRLDERCSAAAGDGPTCADCGGAAGASIPYSAQYAVQRRAWFAYQRLTTALRYVSHVRMLLPNTDEIDRSSDTDLDAVVFELIGSVRDPDTLTSYPFGYLVLLDLWRDSADLELIVRSTSGTGVSILRVATCTGDPIDGSSATADLPFGTPSFTASYTKWVPSTGVTVALGRNPPRLFLSTTRLDWSISPFADVPHHGASGAEEA